MCTIRIQMFTMHRYTQVHHKYTRGYHHAGLAHITKGNKHLQAFVYTMCVPRVYMCTLSIYKVTMQDLHASAGTCRHWCIHVYTHVCAMYIHVYHKHTQGTCRHWYIHEHAHVYTCIHEVTTQDLHALRKVSAQRQAPAGVCALSAAFEAHAPAKFTSNCQRKIHQGIRASRV